MPDRFRFDALPHWGVTYHRCIEEGCDFPGELKTLSEKERERHHNEHVKQQQREAKKAQDANLALARKVKKQREREDALIDERFGEESP